MRKQIEQALTPLIGLPFWTENRAADMQMFQFGQRHTQITHRGKIGVWGDYGLHVQCPWRVTGVAGIVVGSHDVYYPAGDPNNEPPDFAWDKAGANRRDERLRVLFSGREGKPLLVVAVSADGVGGAVFVLSEGVKFEIWPHDSLPGEHWRLIEHRENGNTHFVVTGAGIED